MYWSISSLIALMSGVFILAFVYFYLFLHYRERYILLWALSWLLYAISYVFAFWFAAKMEKNYLIIFVDYRSQLFIFNQITLLLSSIFLLWGTYTFINKKLSGKWIYSCFLGMIWVVIAIFSNVSIRVTTLPTYAFLGFIYIWTGNVFFHSTKFLGVGKHITSLSFIIWGIYKLFLPIIGEESWLTPWGYLISWHAPWGFLINMIMTFIVSIGILLIFFNRKSLELAVSEERFRLLAENAGDIIYRLLLKPKLKIEYISPASLNILGIRPEIFYNNPKKILQLLSSEDRRILFNLLKDKEKRSEIIRCKNNNGQSIWIELNKVPIYDKSGFLVAVEGIARDITLRKNAEFEILAARERASRTERMASLGIMAAGISHEINQPLNSLMVLVDSMLYWYNKNKTISLEKVIENLKKISSRVDRIDKIIKHMHSFVKSERSSELEECNVNEAIEGAIAIVGMQIKSHGIEIEKSLEKNIPDILAVKLRLEEIIINLLINSMQALDKSELTNKKIICSTSYENQSVFLEISDNGPGIKEDIKDKIFELFFTTKLDEQGMGLGLFLVQSLVSCYNGRIFVFNNKYGGASFQIEFPAYIKSN